MIRLFYRLFNHDKIDDKQRTIDLYHDRITQLEADVREYKSYKLKYEVTKLYVEDDEALLEIFEVAKRNAEMLSRLQAPSNFQLQQQGLMNDNAAQNFNIRYGLGMGAANRGIFG